MKIVKKYINENEIKVENLSATQNILKNKNEIDNVFFNDIFKSDGILILHINTVNIIILFCK